MKTEVLQGDPVRAAEILQDGGLVAVPTETVYGLAGNGLDPVVIERIYQVKGRPAVKPISLMVPDLISARAFCESLPPQAETLACRFWPGPLTIVLPAKRNVPAVLRAGGSTIGLRCPLQEDTLSILKLLPFPLAVPSANPSGAESPVNVQQVLGYFNGSIEAVVDGGICTIGKASTVLDMSVVPYRILRSGSLTEEEIADALVDEMMVIGITGGSGSGKTTALSVFEEHDALILDCDAIYHQLLETDTALIAELCGTFPDALENGHLSRRRLGNLVFSDTSALQHLNLITHRYIERELHRRLRAFAMSGGRLAAIDASELISSGLAAKCDVTIAVLAEQESRIRRIMSRDSITREGALLRIRAQQPDSYFIQHCDYVIYNNDDPTSFIQELNLILEGITKNGTKFKERR